MAHSYRNKQQKTCRIENTFTEMIKSGGKQITGLTILLFATGLFHLQ
jgi:hypothetical protein